LRLRRPSHATVVAYLALFVALGGSVYAANRISGKRLKPNSVTGRQVRESSLNASQFLPANGGTRNPCAGPTATTDLCASTTLRLHHASWVVAIATGGWSPVVAPQPSVGAENQLLCNLGVDNNRMLGIGQQQAFGETQLVNHSPTATTPLALAGISNRKVKPGKHRVQLFCDSQTDVVEKPTIVAFAINGGR
jgi:hypothetical protein